MQFKTQAQHMVAIQHRLLDVFRKPEPKEDAHVKQQKDFDSLLKDTVCEEVDCGGLIEFVDQTKCLNCLYLDK